MQPVTRYIHIVNHPCSVQSCELQTKSSRVFGLDPGFASCLEIAPQALMLERLDHQRSIACCASRNKRCFSGLCRGIKRQPRPAVRPFCLVKRAGFALAPFGAQLCRPASLGSERPPRCALRLLSPAVNRRSRAGPARVNLLFTQNQILTSR